LANNILLISYYYPPINHIASNRMFSFSKYMDQYNIWVITVASQNTIQNLNHVKVYRCQDSKKLTPTFYSNEGKFIHIMKVAYNIFISNAVVDLHKEWTHNAIELCKNLLIKTQFDLMISSSGPLASHLVALDIKKRHPEIKWIADMRDELLTSKYLPHRQRIHNPRVKVLEKRIINKADAITAVSNPILMQIKDYSNNPNTVFREIRNGYDFEFKIDYKPPKRDFINIVYAGGLSGGRDPYVFLKACEELVEKHNLPIKVKFIGPNKEINIPAGIIEHVEVIDSVPHVQAIQAMNEADVLLLIIALNGRTGGYSGKLFEYMASLRPIIALVPPHDVAAELIRESKTGYVLNNPNDIKEIKEVLLMIYEKWKVNNLHNKFYPDLDIIAKHHRKEQAKLVHQLISYLTNSEGGSAK